MTTCEYFARCYRAAHDTVSHPILGEVPTCRYCIRKMEISADKITPVTYPAGTYAAFQIAAGGKLRRQFATIGAEHIPPMLEKSDAPEMLEFERVAD